MATHLSKRNVAIMKTNYVLLDNIDCFSTPEEIQAVIDEFEAKQQPEVYGDLLKMLRDDLKFSQKLYENGDPFSETQ